MTSRDYRRELWIKSISNELDITIHVIASQLSGYCDVINKRLWHHQQNLNQRVRHWVELWRSSFLSSFLSLLCHVRNKIMYVLLWRTIFSLTQVLFWWLFPSLLHNSGNKYQITLSWALKQFVTLVQTLFSINSHGSQDGRLSNTNISHNDYYHMQLI